MTNKTLIGLPPGTRFGFIGLVAGSVISAILCAALVLLFGMISNAKEIARLEAMGKYGPRDLNGMAAYMQGGVFQGAVLAAIAGFFLGALIGPWVQYAIEFRIHQG